MDDMVPHRGRQEHDDYPFSGRFRYSDGVIFMRHKEGWQQITDEMLKLREQGYTNKEIGEKLHYSRNAVSSRIGRRPKDLMAKKMLALREQGMSNREIAEAIGYHQLTVYRAIGKNARKVPRGHPPRFKSDEMRALREQGMSNREISEAMGCDVSTVDRVIGHMRHHYGQVFDEAVRDLHAQGFSGYRIGQELGVSAETVRRHAKQMGLTKER